jgi:splicing factor 3A subunit 1
MQYPAAAQFEDQRARPESPAAAPGQPAMRIRQDYVPRAQARRQASAMALCPNCHQQIPVAELDHHMRIELLDPRWKEQRAKAESRSATTNLSTVDVVNNLKRLASQRSDVFDSSLAPNVDPEEEARRKRMAVGADGSLPPGAPGPALGPNGAQTPQNMNIEEQLRHIHQRARQ